MYKPINGYTKQKIIDTIKARIQDKPCYTLNSSNYSQCLYSDENGNHCAVGAFIPDTHAGMSDGMSVANLLDGYSDLKALMPLELDALRSLQRLHDSCVPENNRGVAVNPVPLLVEWVNENVLDEVYNG